MSLLLLMLPMLLAGRMAQSEVTSWLDPVSVATITSQAEPLTLVRVVTSSRTKRTFAQLTAIEINRMGARRLYLVLTPRMSDMVTPDQRVSFERSFEQAEIRLDERSVALARYTDSVAELGIGEPALLPIFGSRHIYYPIERAQLHAMATSTRFEFIALGLSNPQPYKERNEGRRSLGEFVSQLPGATADSQKSEAP